ncbi:hypothetical protein QFZ38_001105 [Pseudomonas cedrina]|nr:hypothetical protein [Pseudomonas cedrina]
MLANSPGNALNRSISICLLVDFSNFTIRVFEVCKGLMASATTGDRTGLVLEICVIVEFSSSDAKKHESLLHID